MKKPESVMQTGRLISLSQNPPSFNSYSSVNLAEIAARVVEELRIQGDDDSQFDWAELKEQNEDVDEHNDVHEEDHDSDSDFAFVCRVPDSSPVSADDIFYNGQIKPVYPYMDFLINGDSRVGGNNSGNSVAVSSTDTKTEKTKRRSPLRKLFSEETSSSSCSSSEADELDSVDPETYCVWNPNRTDGENRGSSSARMREKSNSTGSSKRWRLRDLMHRSNSDGKDSFVFLTPSKKKADKVNFNVEEVEVVTAAEKTVVKEDKQFYYLRNDSGRCGKDGDTKRQPYLPFKKDLMGIFSNVHGLNRNLRPF